MSFSGKFDYEGGEKKLLEYWYKYRSDLWKRVIMNDYGDGQFYRPRKVDSDEKLKSNIRRAARCIEGYALCNHWDWFGTFTLNPQYRDRKDLDGFRRDFMQLIRSCRKKYSCDIEALLVPELHKSKEGWHMHGLFDGLPQEALRAFTLSERLPVYLRNQIKAGHSVYDWPDYRRAFGWVDIEAIRSRDAAARYITKYITKAGDSTAQALELGKHLYYATRGLRKPERVETENAPGCVPEAFPAGLIVSNTYQWDYGEVVWYEPPR